MSNPTRNFEEIAKTLQLPTETLQLGETLRGDAAVRDTLRTSLPRLALGSSDDSQFQVTAMLGQGGMGVVHLAYQPALGRHVALKTVPSGRTSREAENALLQEARVMGFVEHPNVVPVYIIGQDDEGRPLIVMKRIEGTSWDRFLDGAEDLDGEEPLAFHLRILLAVCQAVSCGHSRGILHRDIKPENVMIGPFGEVYLLDWGLAVSIDDDLHYVPKAREQTQIVGTPAYLAPEMTVGDGAKLGVHTDVFLLGAVLYHILTGEPPNRGKSLFDALACAYEGRARTYPADVPWELRDIAERAMALTPADRFASVAELHDAVTAAVGHRTAIQLTNSAYTALDSLRAAIADNAEPGVVHTTSGEATFGFQTALSMWRQCEPAHEGLQECLRLMVEYELAHDYPVAARGHAAQLSPPDEALNARIDAAEQALAAQARKLEKIAYDYDADVGVTSRKGLVGLLAVLFALPLFVPSSPDVQVPAQLAWITDDIDLLIANTWGVVFAPVVVGTVWYIFKHFVYHKSSRLFAESLIIMYILGFGLRLSSIVADVPLHFAVAAESLVYAAVLVMLGIAVERRFFLAGVIFVVVGFSAFFVQQHVVGLFCAGAVMACIIYISHDFLRRYIPALARTMEDRLGHNAQ